MYMWIIVYCYCTFVQIYALSMPYIIKKVHIHLIIQSPVYGSQSPAHWQGLQPYSSKPQYPSMHWAWTEAIISHCFHGNLDGHQNNCGRLRLHCFSCGFWRAILFELLCVRMREAIRDALWEFSNWCHAFSMQSTTAETHKAVWL